MFFIMFYTQNCDGTENYTTLILTFCTLESLLLYTFNTHAEVLAKAEDSGGTPVPCNL